MSLLLSKLASSSCNTCDTFSYTYTYDACTFAVCSMQTRRHPARMYMLSHAVKAKLAIHNNPYRVVNTQTRSHSLTHTHSHTQTRTAWGVSTQAETLS